MTVDFTALPGLLWLWLELVALAGVGYVVARVALGQSDDRMALAQGLVIGLALWGLIANFAMAVIPGLAGASVAWATVLALGASLAWRSPGVLRLSLHTVTGFVVAAHVLFWVALASRQLISITDPDIHLGLAASIRSGIWPPTLPWNPDNRVFYHYGTDLLVGLLTPPFGLGPVFMTELLGAYVWTSLLLVVGTALIRTGGMLAVALLPLMLTAGAWTLVHYTEPPGILQVPVPAGVPAAGLRASLADIYWPTVEAAELPWRTPVQVSPPNIWQPLFALAYALAVVVISCAACDRPRSWPALATLAVLVAFVGLLEETVALTVLTLWGGLEVSRIAQSRDERFRVGYLITRSAVGPGLALLLLALGGGVVTGVLAGSVGGGLGLGWIDDPGSRRVLAFFESLPGGVGVLEIGLVPTAIAAGLLSRRNRIVLALVAGSGVFLLAAFALQYEPARDVTRLDGHARNFALLALLFALVSRLPALHAKWRPVAIPIVAAMVIWPTVIAPMHNIGQALSRGPQFSNAPAGPPDALWSFLGRYAIRRPPTQGVAAYIRTHTATDARILSPSPTGLSVATGRPNAAGYSQFAHYSFEPGPEYLDAIRYLEPAAIRRRGFDYIHSTEIWTASLPDRARLWLADPRLFELLHGDGTDKLYRILPAFLSLDSASPPSSYEALNEAVPASSTLYFSPSIRPKDAERLATLRAAASLWHTRRLGVEPSSILHLQTRVPTEPLGSMLPDFVITSAVLAPSALSSNARQPIWWNQELAVYSVRGDTDPTRSPPRPIFTVRLSDVRTVNGQINFAAKFTDRAPGHWKGQDWLVMATDASPWAIPSEFEADGQRHAGVQWYAGQIIPGQKQIVRTYTFDPHSVNLSAGDDADIIAAARSSGEALGPGVWTLAVRLRDEWWEVAIIPVMKIVVTTGGEVRYEVYEGELDARILQ